MDPRGRAADEKNFDRMVGYEDQPILLGKGGSAVLAQGVSVALRMIYILWKRD